MLHLYRFKFADGSDLATTVAEELAGIGYGSEVMPGGWLDCDDMEEEWLPEIWACVRGAADGVVIEFQDLPAMGRSR